MKGKQLLGYLLSLAMVLTSADFTVLAAEMNETAGYEQVLSTVSDGDNAVSNGDSTVSEVDVSGGNTVSDNEKQEEEKTTVSEGDNNSNTEPNVSGGDNNKEEPTVSGGDNAGDKEPSVSSGDATTDEKPEEKPTEPVNPYPYVIDANGVLTSWETAEGVITIPSEVKTIGSSVFKDNTNITQIIIPEGVTEIEDKAFMNCTSLSSVRVPKSLTAIGDSSFENCRKMYMVYTESTDYSALKTIGARAFAGCEALSMFMSGDEFALGDTIASIGAEAFESCKMIKSITLPKRLSSMGSGVFKNCQNLTDVTWSSNFVTIPAYTFSECYALNHIGWNGVTKVETYAFNNCTSLVYVVINNDTIELANSVFPTDHKITICGTQGSNAEDYVSMYPTLTFETKGTADKNTYVINSNMITEALPGVRVYAYTKTTNSEGVEVITEVTEAKTKQLVYIELQNIPTGYELIEDSLKVNGEVLGKIQKDSQTAEATQDTYYFYQKRGGAYLTAEFKKVKYGDALGTVTWDTSESILNGMKVGQTVQLYLFSTNDKLEKPLNASRFTFSGYDKDVIEVTADNQGKTRITAKKAGKTFVIVKNNYDQTKVAEFEVQVLESQLAKMDLYCHDYISDITVEEHEDTGSKNITLEKKTVKNKDVTVQINVNGWDAEGTVLNSAFKWSSSDTKIAKLASASTTVGKAQNTITIPKGASGEATITVTAQDNSKLTKYIHVRVVDATPSLEMESEVFNSYKEEPLELFLIESYGYDVVESSFELSYTEKPVIAGDTTEENNKKEDIPMYFKLVADTQDDQKYILKAANGYEVVPEGTYKLDIKGETEVGPFPYYTINVQVKNTLPDVKVKQTGKINWFYTSQGPSQSIETKVSGYGNAQIAYYALENLTDADATLKADYAKFTDNFAIDSETGVIYRVNDEPGVYTKGEQAGKPVVTGLLEIYFKGYAKPQTVQITIANGTIKPTLTLSSKSGTFNISKSGDTPQVRLQLLEKVDKKQVVVDLEALGYRADFNWDKSTGAFKEHSNAPVVTIEGDELVLSFEKITGAGKVAINLRNDVLWGDAENNYLELYYTVKNTQKIPKASLSQKKITLNALYQEQQATFTLKANQPDCTLASTQIFTPVESSKAGYMDSISRIKVEYTNGIGKVTMEEPSRIEAGTYKFTCVVESNDYYPSKDGSQTALNKVTLSVVINKTQPQMKLKSAKFSMNFKTAGYETVAKAVTFKNAPVEGAGYVLLAQPKIVSGNADVVNFVFEDGALKATLNGDNPQLVATNYKYKLCPVFEKNGQQIVGKELQVTVVVQNKEIKASLSGAKGKLDLLNRAESGVSYKIKIANVNDTMANPQIYELISGSPQADESDKFYAVVEDGRLVVKAYEDARIESGKTYSLQVRYELASTPDVASYTIQKAVKVKPTQVFPKVTQSKKTVNLYLSNRNYCAEVVITPKKGSTATIADVAWAKGVTDKVKNSFVIQSVSEPDAETGAVTVRLKLADRVFYAAGNSPTLKFAIVCDGQLEDTQGTTFSVKAKIKR